MERDSYISCTPKTWERVGDDGSRGSGIGSAPKIRTRHKVNRAVEGRCAVIAGVAKRRDPVRGENMRRQTSRTNLDVDYRADLHGRFYRPRRVRCSGASYLP